MPRYSLIIVFFLAANSNLISQSGFENIIIEKYYIAEPADWTTPNFPVPPGAVTYRVYVDLAPDWGLQAIFGATNTSSGEVDTLVIRSTAPFFNNEDFGRAFGYLISTNNLDEHTTLLDSWFSTGRAGHTTVGVLKPEDTNGNLPAFPNQHGLLQHDDPEAGIPINVNDGIITSANTATWTLIGMTIADLAVFDDINLVGDEFTETDGALSNFGAPVQGPTADNKILVGQFTTAGDFSGQLNLQIRHAITGEVQQWVAASPGAGQFTSPSLTWTNNQAPLITLTSPFNGQRFTSGEVITISADALDTDGNIAEVRFYYNNQLISIDASAPYGLDFSDPHSGTLVAEAVDNAGASTFSAAVAIDINPYKLQPITQLCNDDIACIPLHAIGFGIENKISFDVMLSFDNSMIEPTGNIIKSNQVLQPNFFRVDHQADILNGTIAIQVSLDPVAPPGTVFTGTGELFCVEFIRLPGFTISDSTSIGFTSIRDVASNGEISDRDTLPEGQFKSLKNNAYLGSIADWQYGGLLASTDAVIIYGTATTCAIDSSLVSVPDEHGIFQYDLSHGHDIIIGCDIGETADVSNEINSFDAYLTRKVLLNDKEFIPSVFQFAAMDVNQDGIISAGDVSQINQRRQLTEFLQQQNYTIEGTTLPGYTPSRDWNFISEMMLDFDPAFHRSSNFPKDDGIGFSKRRVPIIPMCQWTGEADDPFHCPEPNVRLFYGVQLGDVIRQ